VFLSKVDPPLGGKRRRLNLLMNVGVSGTYCLITVVSERNSGTESQLHRARRTFFRSGSFGRPEFLRARSRRQGLTRQAPIELHSNLQSGILTKPARCRAHVLVRSLADKRGYFEHRREPERRTVQRAIANASDITGMLAHRPSGWLTVDTANSSGPGSNREVDKSNDRARNHHERVHAWLQNSGALSCKAEPLGRTSHVCQLLAASPSIHFDVYSALVYAGYGNAFPALGVSD
jgi:hypothetical protein